MIILNLLISFFILFPSLKCATNCESCEDGSDKCKDSMDGYYMNSGDKKCYTCSSNCKTCIQYSACLSCDSGYKLCSSSKYCYQCNINCKTKKSDNCACASCSEGKYLYCNECHQCSSGCKVCSSSSYCSSCYGGYFLFQYSCYQCNVNCNTTIDNCKCNNCSDGYYLSIYQCFQCNSNCKTCYSKATNCTSCNDGYYLNLNKCQQCPNTCKTCSNLKTCKTCIINHFLSSGMCYPCNINNCNKTDDGCKCDICNDGYYFNIYQCSQCYLLCKTCSILANNCTSCKDGYYLDKSVCKACISPCKTCLNDKICTSCVDNHFLSSGTCYKCNLNNCKISNDNCRCDICNNGHYFNNYQCSNCAELNCTTCSNGYNKLIIYKYQCIDDCSKDKIYTYEHNNRCYLMCPINTYQLEDVNNSKCYDAPPNNYYLDKKNSIYKKCYETCDTCITEGNKTNHNCINCRNNFQFYTNTKNITNCYNICEYFYYFDEFDNFHCTEFCTDRYNKTIFEKKICIDSCLNDDKYIYEYSNTCFEKCPNETIVNETLHICYKEEIIETTIINSISLEEEFNLEVEKYRKMINNFNASENKDIIKKDKNKNIQYQLTTSENQKNSSCNNLSTIDLGTCEDRLKSENGIDPSLPLIIFKIDYFPPDSLIPIIGYEIYHPITKEKLNLSLCEDVFMKLNIPINIDENNLFKYDPNSKFYTDNCFSYTTENGTDIIMKDRKQEFSDNKLSICEDDCTFVEYNQQDKQSSCDCKIKNKENTILEILESTNQLGNNFKNEESDTTSASSASNIISITCTKALFSKDGLKNNISSYILIIFITHYLVSILLFIKCGYPMLINDIKKIINEKQKVKKQIHKSNQITSQIGQKSKKIQKNLEKKYQSEKLIILPKKVNSIFSII